MGGPSVTDMEHDSPPSDRPTHPLRLVLAESARAIDGVGRQPLWSLGDTELIDLVEEAYGLVFKAHVLALSVVSEASASELGDRVGAPSLAGSDLPEHGGVPPQLVVTIDQQHLTGASQTVSDDGRHRPGLRFRWAGWEPRANRYGRRRHPALPHRGRRYACESDPVLALLTHGIATWISRRDRHARGVLRLARV